MKSKLSTLVLSSGLDKVERKSLIEQFDDYESIAKQWKEKAMSIVVTDRSQATEMAMAKEARKKFSKLRIDVEHSRKSLKEQSLRKGQAIDSIAKYLVSLISPIEDHLKAQEDFIKLDDARIVNKQLEADEKKAEEERVAQEKADEVERKRIKAENVKLKLEVEARELKMIKNQEAAEKKEAEATKEREAAAEKLRLQQEAADKKEQKLKEEQQIKLKAEADKVEKAERELREKKEAEEETASKILATAREEAANKLSAEKDKNYQKWLTDNKYDPKDMILKTEGTKITMWKQVSSITLEQI